MAEPHEENHWEEADSKQIEPQIEALRLKFGISFLLAKLLVLRNLTNENEVEEYLTPRGTECHDPLLLRDMEVAIERILRALTQGETVVVYGDYDVDGMSATVLLYRYLRRLGMRVHYFIPQRLKNGYGLTAQVLNELKERKTQLIITVDNGSTAVEESHLLKGMGIDLLITDHHQFGTEVPEACAIVNPLHPDCNYPFKGLSGTGVAYKLLCGLHTSLTDDGFWNRTEQVRPDLKRDLDLVAFATIADRMPLAGENRFFVQQGLELMNPCRRPGIQALVKSCGVRGRVTPGVISFKLAPKINAVGRLDDPSIGIRLLLSNSISEAKPYAKQLIQLNRQRQRIEENIFQDAFFQAEDQQEQAVIILMDKDWHPGVMGSIASRVSRQYNKTTIALTLAPASMDIQGESSQLPLAVGSARGVGDLNLCSILHSCSDILEQFGGHPAAAGLSFSSDRFDQFCERFHELFKKMECNQTEKKQENKNLFKIDAWLTQDQLRPELLRELLKMSPFGMNNPEPILGIRNVLPKNASIFGRHHLKFYLESEEQNLEAVAWGHSDWFASVQGQVDLAVSPQVYGRSAQDKHIQFKVLDLKPANSTRLFGDSLS